MSQGNILSTYQPNMQAQNQATAALMESHAAAIANNNNLSQQLQAILAQSRQEALERKRLDLEHNKNVAEGFEKASQFKRFGYMDSLNEKYKAQGMSDVERAQRVHTETEALLQKDRDEYYKANGYKTNTDHLDLGTALVGGIAMGGKWLVDKVKEKHNKLNEQKAAKEAESAAMAQSVGNVTQNINFSNLKDSNGNSMATEAQGTPLDKASQTFMNNPYNLSQSERQAAQNAGIGKPNLNANSVLKTGQQLKIPQNATK